MPHRMTVFVILMTLASGACGTDPWPWDHEMQRQASLATTVSPREPPPRALTTTGEVVMDRDAAERLLHNPFGPSVAPQGRALYTMYCTPCHGVSGRGDGPVPRHFALDAQVRVADLTSDAVQRHADGWLYATITAGTARMPALRFEVTPDERWKIVTFVRELRAPGR